MPTTETAVTIPPDHARRFLVRRHLLAPPRSLPADPASVLKVIERLGLLQFDPIEVPGARSHALRCKRESQATGADGARSGSTATTDG